MDAQLNCLGTGRNRVMITVLQNSGKTFATAFNPRAEEL